MVKILHACKEFISPLYDNSVIILHVQTIIFHTQKALKKNTTYALYNLLYAMNRLSNLIFHLIRTQENQTQDS